MKLKNSLYDIMESKCEGEKAQYRIALNPECLIYKAHFPGMPITPGVCIIQIVKELFEESLHTPLQISLVKNAKFLTAMIPDGKEFVVTLSNVKSIDGTHSVQSTITDTEGSAYAKISLQAINA